MRMSCVSFVPTVKRWVEARLCRRPFLVKSMPRTGGSLSSSSLLTPEVSIFNVAIPFADSSIDPPASFAAEAVVLRPFVIGEGCILSVVVPFMVEQDFFGSKSEDVCCWTSVTDGILELP